MYTQIYCNAIDSFIANMTPMLNAITHSNKRVKRTLQCEFNGNPCDIAALNDRAFFAWAFRISHVRDLMVSRMRLMFNSIASNEIFCPLQPSKSLSMLLENISAESEIVQALPVLTQTMNAFETKLHALNTFEQPVLSQVHASRKILSRLKRSQMDFVAIIETLNVFLTELELFIKKLKKNLNLKA